MLQPEDTVISIGRDPSQGGRAAYDLGMAYSSGSDGFDVDLVQAHRWLNVAALCGYRPALAVRAEVAAEMSRGEVVEAQRLARVTFTRAAA